MRYFQGSWRTTSAAVLLAVSSIFIEISYMLDDDDKTNVNFARIMSEVAIMYGLLNARDDKVTSEQARAG